MATFANGGPNRRLYKQSARLRSIEEATQTSICNRVLHTTHHGKASVYEWVGGNCTLLFVMCESDLTFRLE